MKITGGQQQPSRPPTTKKPSLPATHREHLGGIAATDAVFSEAFTMTWNQ
jgi:hypothetical protein